MSRRLITVIIIATAAFMDLLDGTIANIALPTIQRELGATPLQLQWVIAGYGLAFATTLITGGRLGDIFGRKKVFLLGVAGFTIASLFAALADSGSMLVTSRIIQGLFAGLMIPQLGASVVTLYRPEERAPIWGILGALVPLGTIMGMILGGWLVTANLFETSWRSVFLINVPIGLVTFISAAVIVARGKTTSKKSIDLLGVLFSGSGIFLLMYALGKDIAKSTTLAMIAAAFTLLVLFVFQQRGRVRRGKPPVLPLYLFRDRGYSGGMALEFFFTAASGSYGIVLTFLAQQALHFSPLLTGLLVVPLVASAILITPLVVHLSKKYGKALIALGGTVQALAFLWVVGLINLHGLTIGYWDLFYPFVLAGAGMMFVAMPLNDLSLASVSEKHAGIASGVLTTVTQIGMATGVTITGTIFFSNLRGDDPVAVLHAASIAFGVSVLAYLIVGIGAFVLPRRNSQL